MPRLKLPLCTLPLLCACSAGLPAQLHAGDLVLLPHADGSFDLQVGGRTLLSGKPGPVRLVQQDLSADSLFGFFDFTQLSASEARPVASVSAYADGDALVLDLADGDAGATLRFSRADGEVTIVADGQAPGLMRNSLKLDLACTQDAHFLGFGEQYQTIDHRGEAFPLWTSEQGIGRDPAHPCSLCGTPYTSYFPVPFFLDPRGFGLALDTTARVNVDLCKSDPSTYTLQADESGPLILHLYTGPTVAQVLTSFTVRQGRARPAPPWSVQGAWLGVQGGPDAVRQAVQRAQAAGVPVAAVWVQDWVGRRDLGAGYTDIKYHWTVDQTLYPDLPGLIAELRGQGVRFLGYFNPFIEQDMDQWAEATQKGYTIKKDDGTPYVSAITVSTGSMLDVTNPDAVAWFQGFAKSALDMGMSGWMGDYGEWLPYDAVLHSGQAPLVHNLYPMKWHQTWQPLLSDDQVVFTRSGWLGEGAAAQVVWIGDQDVDWTDYDGLPTVVPALISLGMAGIGWVTHDIAGYYGGPSTKELYMRWMELGAFTPIFRTHEGLESGNNWRWYSDAETLAAFSRWSRVHGQLAATFIALGEEHRRTGMPIVRALALTWPDDPRAVQTSDEFTIGDDLLVAPVVTQGATTRSVYLPAGHWSDVWDLARAYDGPAAVTVDAPIGRPPVFSRSARADLAPIQ